MHRVIKFKQEAWLKPSIDMNTVLRKNSQTMILKKFFQADEYCKFSKNYEKCERTLRYQTCKSVRSKLSFNKFFS